MVKKGKSAASAGSSSAKKAPAEDDFIVFTNSTKEPKARKGGPSDPAKAGGSASGGADGAADGPPKPTVKQIIGGQSWTGKLPVNLLSEHCQKQRWERPDYDTVSR